MPNKRKLYVEPGALAKKKNAYESARNKNIERNIARMSETGARQLVQALQNPSRRQLSLEDEHDDVDKEYRPSRHSEEELNLSDEEELQDEVVASSSRRVRGRVVGHESEKRMKILGSRISVLLETWGAIDDGCKEAIFTAAAQKYDFGYWKTDAHVAVAVGRLAMHIYREFTAELHRAYKKLLEKGQDLKQCPHDTQRAAQWIWLIENKWETPEWKQLSVLRSCSINVLGKPRYLGVFYIINNHPSLP
ncbi:hypothetical protein MRB53_020842 [Persea americana]|uniref:Uncharacterized protein n=1 Tax=Persea americana TaxID=3435 RepID=A0ACC2L2I2_PERAE|nr:hypothetical protein MRB53_020842 [Persea americana]